MGAWIAWASATQGPDWDRLRADLRQPELLRGAFTQEKHVAGFRSPLHSTGRFVVVRGKGVLWDTVQPFPSTLTVRDDGMRVDGEPVPMRGTAAERVQSLLMGVLAGDLARLEEDFALTLRWTDAGWELKLVPRERALVDLLRDFRLRGDAYVESVEYVDEHGNRTRIEFDRQQESDAALPDAEAARLD